MGSYASLNLHKTTTYILELNIDVGQHEVDSGSAGVLSGVKLYFIQLSSKLLILLVVY